MFVQLDVGLANSELVDHARTDLGLVTDAAIGKLFRFWEAVLLAKCDGLIGHRSDKWMEEAVAWTGEIGRFAAFVRARMLDDEGVVRGWDERYGALNRKRARDQKSQAAKRYRDGSARRTDVSADDGVDVSADVSAGIEHKSVHPSITSSSSSSSSLSVAVAQEQQGQQQRDQSRERPDQLVATLVEARLDLTGFQEGDRAVIEGALRASHAPLARAVVLAAALKDHPPIVVGRAFREFIASEQPWSTRLFGGFVKDAAKQVLVGENRQRTVRETKHIDREAIERERERREELEVSEMLSAYSRTHIERFEQLKGQAEAKTHPRWMNATRAVMVKAELVRLVREEVTMAQRLQPMEQPSR